MKLIREHINEKFIEKSDPIIDMGIGLYIKRNFKNAHEYADFMYNNLAVILHKKKIPRDYLHGRGYYFNKKYDKLVDDYLEDYVTVNDHPVWNSDNMILHRLLLDKGFKEI
jgi:hypothetical protein